MRFHLGLRVAACVLWLTSPGCTALREVPRGQFGAQSQRDHVRVVTRDGLLYDFDFARFASDSVTGFKRTDPESRIEEYASLGFSLGDVAHMATRQVDWTRTGLIGGVILLGVLVGAYKATQNNNGPGGGGGGPIRPPPS